MPSRVPFAVAAGVSASFGFAAGHFAPRSPPPARVVTRVVSGPVPVCPRASSPAAPLLAPLAHPPPLSPSHAPIGSEPRAPAGSEPRAPAGSEARAPVAVGSPLAAFRFAGLGPAGGLRLARVRAGTLPAALGLRSGDELVSVNDFRLSDPEQALTAYARLRSAERLRLTVIRDGAQTELVYFMR